MIWLVILFNPMEAKSKLSLPSGKAGFPNSKALVWTAETAFTRWIVI